MELTLEPLGYLAIFFAGLILGLIGGGGSILSIPILVYLFSIDIVTATAFSLFIVGLTSLVGAGQRFKSNTIDVQVGLIFGVPSIAAVFATRKWLIPILPEVLLQNPVMISKRFFVLGLFSLLVIIASILMITRQNELKDHSGKVNLPALATQGLVIGLITGLVGVGGGFLIVPSLFFLARIPIRTAIGTTLLIIALKSLIGFMGDVLNYAIDWLFLLRLSLVSVVGILLGTHYSHRISPENLKKGFGWFTLVVGIIIFINEALAKSP